MGHELSDQRVGVVAIGRNEGMRLRLCLESLIMEGREVLYVDSGSTDGSRALAKELGAEVLELDLSTPFTAARARNAGWRYLTAKYPSLDSIQFVDGDCELATTWMHAALASLAADDNLAVVCGRRRERFPNATIYNLFCDIEWDTPIGSAESCGGDALIRVSALQEVNGFDDSSIAGEEPEMCFRLRVKGWRIERIDAEMTLHDADISTVRQWWQRSKRAGHAYAGNYRRHRSAGFRKGELRSAFFWGFFLPLILGLAGVLVHPLAFFGFVVYPLQVLRVAWQLRASLSNHSFRNRLAYAVNCVGSKLPHFVGILDERRSHRKGRIELIEYK
jgi:glycosyltransferase involved in cell wall biosynthesis